MCPSVNRMRLTFIPVAILLGRAGVASADTAIRCDDLATADYTIDGLLDDWGKQPVVARAGAGPTGGFALRCAWDGTALALALDVTDDRVVRTKTGNNDHVQIAIDGATLADWYPGNALQKPRGTAARKVAVADSLQPAGFSIEARIPASAIARLSPSTPSLALKIVFHDADRASGAGETTIPLDAQLVLGDRADLLDDFLKATHLKKSDLRLDTLVDVDPDRKGKERVVAGGNAIGVLTDKFAFVTIPVAKPADIQKIELLPLGARGQSVIAAVVRQLGNGGSRDLLMLWTVWSGQLSPLGQIEIRKQLGASSLDSLYTVGRGPELLVEPKSVTGFTADTWNEEAADDADPIVVPWDPKKGGVGYRLKGAELVRRDLPKKRGR